MTTPLLTTRFHDSCLALPGVFHSFYGKAFFDSNEGDSYNGGAVYNSGSMK